jgi:hypothetical protein
MKKLAIFTALLCMGTVPALAAWDEIGTVRVSAGRDRDVKNFDMGGPVERLQLRAEGSDIHCRGVTASFGNGRSQPIFQGPLSDGLPANVSLPGNARTISRLTFDCSAEKRRGGSILVVADVGRHRGDWRRNPRWQSTWARVFNWGSDAINDWKYLNIVKFQGRNDSDTSFAGWRGQNIEAVALKPLDADVRCSRITARFGRGAPQPLNVNNGDLLRRGQYYKLDLPGQARDLESLDMRCRAINARAVTVQIFTSR